MFKSKVSDWFQHLVFKNQQSCPFQVAADQQEIQHFCSQDGQDYVHRIGRTGRAGRKGKAITLLRKGVTPNQNIGKCIKNHQISFRCIGSKMIGVLQVAHIFAHICTSLHWLCHIFVPSLKFMAMSFRSRWASNLIFGSQGFHLALSFPWIYCDYCVFTCAGVDGEKSLHLRDCWSEFPWIPCSCADCIWLLSSCKLILRDWGVQWFSSHRPNLSVYGITWLSQFLTNTKSSSIISRSMSTLIPHVGTLKELLCVHSVSRNLGSFPSPPISFGLDC